MIRAALTLATAAFAVCMVGGAALERDGSVRSSVAALLTETNPPAGFAYAREPRAFVFPDDHGEHPDYRSEWWYFTGNVNDGERAFGFQLTLFRFALRPGGAAAGSPWRSNQVYLAHFAVSDLDNEKFYASERRARPALDQAGVSTNPVAVWLRDWRMERSDGEAEIWRLHAAHEHAAIDLRLQAERAIVAQGDRGLSHKSATPGNASYYYSIPRFAATGTVSIDGTRHDVGGAAWFDHEWSTSALAEDQVGWDWFSLQLDDGRELMFYQLRDVHGRADPASHGVLINRDGSSTTLRSTQITLSVLDYWRSGASGARYPADWRIRIVDHGLDLRVRPRMAAQEWHDNFTYWEGAVTATGTADGVTIAGRGYVELVGYATGR
jgi:predicted secreted hydrolase